MTFNTFKVGFWPSNEVTEGTWLEYETGVKHLQLKTEWVLLAGGKGAQYS